jgi:NhaA family Na+:H+ antiporter
MEIGTLLSPVPLGIAAGLFFGKQIGVFVASMIAVKSGLAKLPVGVGWLQIYGLSCLCGIGFTMSLFIGSLAFEGGGGPDYAINDRIGILTGSFLSAIVGVLVLLSAKSPKNSSGTEEKALDGGLLGPVGDESSN